jgi:hypothetical protein
MKASAPHRIVAKRAMNMDGGLIVLEPFSFSIFSSLKKDQEMALF